MDDALLGLVLDRLGQYPLLEEPADLLLAALESDEAFAAQLDAVPGERYTPPSTAASAQDPVGAYLSSVTVQGFRGIGPAATLTVKEGPGLTLVVGRNGSGKSSFAEGLEVLLTGGLMRWKDAPAVVKEGWRSKHAVTDPAITAEFFVEGKGRATVERTWAATAGTDITKSQAWVQVHGEKRTPIEALGWETDLVEYRPFLSHAELEAFFGRPSDLFDLLAGVLGLEDLTAADKRLQTAAKLRDDKLKAVKQALAPLHSRLASLASQDERAGACAAALSGVKPANWDISAARAVATGSQQQPGNEGQVARLRRLADLTVPPAGSVMEAATALREAADGIAELAGTATGQARDLASLLDAALSHYESHGDGPCPVCGNPGALTQAWRAAAEQHRDRLKEQAAAADEAFEQGKTAISDARLLIQPLPQPLTSISDGDTPAVGDAARAWQRWAALPVDDGGITAERLTALADHLEATHGPLAATVEDVAKESAAELARRDSDWSPLAAEVSAWCESAAAVLAAATSVPVLRTVRDWLTKATAELRDQRLAPLADKSRSIWADLRQESNVVLGDFRLTGANTRRQLDLNVSIDGEPGAALGVMSQGEINALALSIFLPRATIDASPFRFLVIDDPVQAMDPAKVDGLAKVLAKVAKNRQVIVFTHDNRLAAAIKDLAIPATILEVTRQPKSVVTVRESMDAASQAFADARSLNKDPNVPREVAERVIPGLCRTAVEATFMAAYWRGELRKGRTRAEIEQSLESSSKQLNMRTVAMLALFGDVAKSNSVTGELNQWGHSYGDTYKALNKGSHYGDTDLAVLISDAKKLVAKIAEKLP